MPKRRGAADWPFNKSYVESWKSFRTHSNENEVIGSAIQAWLPCKDRKEMRLLDVGCADGALIKDLVQEYQSKINISCVLLEPNEYLLADATLNLSGVGKVTSVLPINDSLSPAIIGNIPRPVTFILFSHVAHLVEPRYWNLLLELLNRDSVLVWIMDSPNSVFSECWSLTAQTYFKRIDKAYKFINALSVRGYSVEAKSAIVSVNDPFNLPETARSGVLSLLAYDDFDGLPAKKADIIRPIIRKRMVGGKLSCDISLFQIKKSSASGLNKVGSEEWV